MKKTETVSECKSFINDCDCVSLEEFYKNSNIIVHGIFATIFICHTVKSRKFDLKIQKCRMHYILLTIALCILNTWDALTQALIYILKYLQTTKK